jgi:hypothetical protein
VIKDYNMEEIFTILTYTPTFEQQQMLRNLVFKLKQNNKKVLVVSHTPIPEDINKLVDYSFYDYDNILVNVWEHTEGFNFYENEYFKIASQFDVFKYHNYGVAVYKLISFGLMLSKNLGYEKCHMIEYDTDFDNLSGFDEINLHLKTNDCVFFKTGQFNDTPILLGSWTSFNLKKYTYDDLNFDEQEIKTLLRKGTTAGMAEIVTFEKLIKNKNYLMLDKEFTFGKINLNLSSTLQSHSGFEKNLTLIPCVKKDTSEVILFGNNHNSHHINVEILYNENEIISFDIDSNSWRYIPLGNLDNLLNLKFYYNNKMFIELDFKNSIPKEEFRLKSVFEEINS